MEYVPGETLSTLIGQEPPLATSAMLRLIEDACAGLAFAHNAGIVHLDVKPENLVRAANGRLKVLDFGIARLVETDETRTMHVMGTLRYMSPEQLTGGPLDRRSDVFGLGCVLYEVIARRPAFGGTMTDIMSRVTGTGVVPLPELVPGVHPTLVRIVTRAMAPDPDTATTISKRCDASWSPFGVNWKPRERPKPQGRARDLRSLRRRTTTRVRSHVPWVISGALVAAFGTGLWLLPDRIESIFGKTCAVCRSADLDRRNGPAPTPAPAAQPEAPKSSETISNQSKATPNPSRARSPAATRPVDSSASSRCRAPGRTACAGSTAAHDSIPTTASG